MGKTKLCTYFSSCTILTQFILLWWPSLFLIRESRDRGVEGQNAGKVVTRKGVNGAKFSITKMHFKTEMSTNLYLQDKTKSNLFHTSSVSRSSISHSWNIFLTLLRLVTLTAIVPPREKTRYIFLLICKSLHLPQIYR